jgi:hypothetical protein
LLSPGGHSDSTTRSIIGISAAAVKSHHLPADTDGAARFVTGISSGTFTGSVFPRCRATVFFLPFLRPFSENGPATSPLLRSLGSTGV